MRVNVGDARTKLFLNIAEKGTAGSKGFWNSKYTKYICLAAWILKKKGVNECMCVVLER